MNMEYRVVWRVSAYASPRFRLYQQRWSAERMLLFMTTPCGKCRLCDPERWVDRMSWRIEERNPCPVKDGIVSWLEERQVEEWTLLHSASKGGDT